MGTGVDIYRDCRARGQPGVGTTRGGGNRWMWGQGCRVHRSVGEQGDTRDHGTGTLLE